MKVSVRFSCPEVLGSLKSGDYEFPPGVTARGLLLRCEEEQGYRVNDEHLKWLLVIVNGRQAGWDAVVPEGSKVLFLRGALGG